MGKGKVFFFFSFRLTVYGQNIQSLYLCKTLKHIPHAQKVVNFLKNLPECTSSIYDCSIRYFVIESCLT